MTSNLFNQSLVQNFILVLVVLLVMQFMAIFLYLLMYLRRKLENYKLIHEKSYFYDSNLLKLERNKKKQK